MLRTAVPALASALLVGTAGVVALGPAQASPAAPSAFSIDFGSCASFSVAADQCGFLSVPMDWSKPAGKQITLAVSRTKAERGEKYQGVAIGNPGGPGASGLGLSSLGSAVPGAAGYDWIGFDPRGVGDSRPAISCDSDYGTGKRPAYVPARQGASLTASEKAWLARSKKYAAACGRKHGTLLEHMKTTDSARDIDALRQALGVDQITWYGFSYGTYLGQVYASMFPARVKRMVLDGNVHPGRVWYQAQLAQDRAFEKAASEFFGWVARHQRTYDLGSTPKTVRKKFYAVLRKLQQQPAQGVDANDWTDVFTRTMYAEFLWSESAGAFARWVHNKDMSELKVALSGAQDSDDNLFAVYNAVQCTDKAWPASYRNTWRPDAFATAAKAPLLTWANTWFNTACLYWPAAPGTPLPIDGSAVPPILIINATLDAATPYAGALAVRSLFPASRLIAESGATTHSGSLNGNTCIEDIIAAYLLDGALPARRSGTTADVTCKALSKPRPGLQTYGASSLTSPAVPAPDPPPAQDRSPLESIIGLLPMRGF
ncbi:MAG: alpha/beta hydrolase [Sporichthyaceae bacterium]